MSQTAIMRLIIAVGKLNTAGTRFCVKPARNFLRMVISREDGETRRDVVEFFRAFWILVTHRGMYEWSEWEKYNSEKLTEALQPIGTIERDNYLEVERPTKTPEDVYRWRGWRASVLNGQIKRQDKKTPPTTRRSIIDRRVFHRR